MLLHCTHTQCVTVILQFYIYLIQSIYISRAFSTKTTHKINQSNRNNVDTSVSYTRVIRQKRIQKSVFLRLTWDKISIKLQADLLANDLQIDFASL